jgi:hypothetical protein
MAYSRHFLAPRLSKRGREEPDGLLSPGSDLTDGPADEMHAEYDFSGGVG